ncbi:hypothetical protein PHLCEN_2v735 [Hermanssonia centrifuga]|uniref:Uncharacterized protein n=1 Tax=Hermanssonia centrifuga TaxID=98765 RepID=A0A2R6S566_9APHY|nr:hypothetical protein PHLCEN_2v735 [Hermanssonia centrifuga]
MSASPTIASDEPQLDAKIAAELQGPHAGIDMMPSEPANTHKIGLAAWFAAYASTFICMSCLLGCILAMLFATRAIAVTFVGFVLLTSYDYFTVGLQDSLTINVSYIIHWQMPAIGAGLIGLVCGPVLTLCMRGVVFAKCARDEVDDTTKAEHMKMKNDFDSVLKSRCSLMLLDVVLGVLMYPVGSFASGWLFLSAFGEDLFIAAPARCIVVGILGGVVPWIISSVWKPVRGKTGGEIQLPDADDSEKDLEKQEPNIV